MEHEINQELHYSKSIGTRVIVCGSRDFLDKAFCFSQLNTILSKYRDPEIVSGHAKGADLLQKNMLVCMG